MDKVKSRKLILTIVLIIAMGVLNWFGHVDSSDFTEFVQWALGFYIAGNVGTKFTGAK